MAESLREVIARRLANSQQSPTPTPTPKVEVPQKVEESEDEFDDDPVVETPIVKQEEVTPQTKDGVPNEKKAQEEMQENMQRIMLLQDSGIFRSELLNQLNEIKKALTILASIGIELTKPNEK